MEKTSQKIKYLYTQDNCSLCKKVKEDYEKRGIVYVEREAIRIKSPMDEVDREALVQASMQNMLLPVEVNIDE